MADPLDLFLAYRQAKNMVFLEQRGVGLTSFAKFESGLHANLKRLAKKLPSGKPADNWFDHLPLGRVYVVPKTTISESPSAKPNHKHVDGEQYKISDLSVRLQLAASVPLYIAEVIYLWEYGPALDAILPPESVGYRLTANTRQSIRKKTQRSLFRPWPKAYTSFREEPFHAAEKLIRESIRRGDKGCYLASLDLASFYDSIDPDFLLQDSFISVIEKTSRKLSIDFNRDRYTAATQSLLRIYSRFRERASAILGVPNETGVPIGTLTSRVIGNVALRELDRRIARRPEVRCYRRYVDDILIAAESTATESDGLLSKWIPFTDEGASAYLLDTKRLRRTGSNLRLQADKMQSYYLAGPAGLTSCWR